MHLRTRAIRLALLAVASVLAIVSVAVPAGAHVSINPGSAAKGSFTIFSFSVPNERDDASTTQVEIAFPTDHPIEFVSAQSKPGWTASVEKQELAKPVKTDDGEITKAVTKITWTGGQIGPNEFDLFTVSAGPLPTKGKKLEFKALQTYSDGEIVRWIESQAKGAPEPEHPAPVLKLTGKAKGHGHD